MVSPESYTIHAPLWYAIQISILLGNSFFLKNSLLLGQSRTSGIVKCLKIWIDFGKGRVFYDILLVFNKSILLVHACLSVPFNSSVATKFSMVNGST